MPPKHQRRSHTKSKKGCSQCKVRRIKVGIACHNCSDGRLTDLGKCNEVHPVCSNCERRSITCDFSLPSDQTQSNGNSSTSPPTSQNEAAVDPFNAPNLVSTKQSTDLDVSDLQLMHHFVLQTAFEMANRHAGQALELWQIHAPTLGFKHDFLLRGILAVSALHAAYMYPQRRREYELMASTHQSLALQSYQEVLPNVDQSNCHALFLFSCLIIVMAFASSIKDEASDFQTDVLHWFYLLRGCNEVIKMHTEILSTGFLKPLLDELNYTQNHPPYDIPDAEKITDLFGTCSSPGQERDVSQAYNMAIHSLLSTFTQASILKKRGEGMVLASFVWPINLPPRFLELLSEKRPQAMVILAHYCILIYWGEVKDTWFMVGWARYMLDTIKASVSEDWHEHLSWPDSIIK